MRAALVGVVAGALSGLFGVGGGVLIVPGLVMVAAFGQRMAHGTSLTAIVPIATYSAMYRCRRTSMSGKCTGIPANFPITNSVPWRNTTNTSLPVGVDDTTDNCPLIANPAQENNDGDAQGVGGGVGGAHREPPRGVAWWGRPSSRRKSSPSSAAMNSLCTNSLLKAG